MSRKNSRGEKAARRARRAFSDAVTGSASGAPAVVTPLLAAFGGQTAAGPAAVAEPGPVMAAIVERFTTGVRAGTVRRCPHLKPDDGAHWGTWAPDDMLCLSCCAEAIQRAAGTSAATACDSCGRQTAPGEPPLSTVAAVCAVTLVYGRLCDSCHRADQAEGSPT